MHRPDIKDSEAYTHLLHQIADPDSGVTKEALLEVRKLKTWTHAETTVQLERRPLRSLVTVDQKICEMKNECLLRAEKTSSSTIIF